MTTLSAQILLDCCEAGIIRFQQSFYMWNSCFGPFSSAYASVVKKERSCFNMAIQLPAS